MFAHSTALAALVGGVLFSTLSLAPAAPVQEDDAEPVALGLLPAARSPIDIPAGRDLSLADLVDSLAESTGLRFVVSSSTRQFLNDTPCGLLAGGTVQPREVYPFVESVLKRHRVALERLAGEEVPVAALYWLDGGRDTSALGWSRVDSDDVAALREHAALLVQTTLDVSPTDARQLANAGRALMRDPQVQFIGAMNESTVILRGTGAEVADLVEVFSQAASNDEALFESRRAAEKAIGSQQPGDGR